MLRFDANPIEIRYLVRGPPLDIQGGPWKFWSGKVVFFTPQPGEVVFSAPLAGFCFVLSPKVANFISHFYVFFTIEFSGLIHLFLLISWAKFFFLLVRWVKVLFLTHQVSEFFFF